MNIASRSGCIFVKELYNLVIHPWRQLFIMAFIFYMLKVINQMKSNIYSTITHVTNLSSLTPSLIIKVNMRKYGKLYCVPRSRKWCCGKLLNWCMETEVDSEYTGARCELLFSCFLFVYCFLKEKLVVILPVWSICKCGSCKSNFLLHCSNISNMLQIKWSDYFPFCNICNQN